MINITHIKERLNWRLPCSFGGLIHDHHGENQIGMALELYLNLYILIHRQQAERE